MNDAPWAQDSLAFFLQAIPAGYVELRADGTISALNRSFSDTLGHDGSGLIGAQFRGLLHGPPDRSLFEEQWRLLESGVTVSLAVGLRGGADEHILVSVFGVPSFGEFDVTSGFRGARAMVVPCAEVERQLGRIERVGTEPQSGLGEALEAQRVLTALTRREAEVVNLLRTGLRVSGIAQQLGLSPYTVRNHLKRIFRKTGVKSQSDLILLLATPRDGSSQPRRAGSR